MKIPVFDTTPSEREIQTATDFTGKLRHLYETGIQGGDSTGFPSLDPHFTVRAREWTLVTGIPSHGKSTFLDAVMVNLSVSHGYRWAVFSAENLPLERHAAALMSQYIGKPFGPGMRSRITPDEFQWARMFVDSHFVFLNPPEDDCTIDRILQTAAFLAKDPGEIIDGLQRGIDGVVIDPWNELDHSRPSQLNETEYISRCLTQVRRFARTHEVHVFIVAHPAKLARIKTIARNGAEAETYPVPTPYDVSGSAHWRNKADNCLCVWRDVEQPGTAEIHVQKIRFREVGSVGMVPMGFDSPTGQYIDRITGLPKTRSLNDLIEISMRPSRALTKAFAESDALLETVLAGAKASPREPGEDDE